MALESRKEEARGVTSKGRDDRNCLRLKHAEQPEAKRPARAKQSSREPQVEEQRQVLHV